MNLESTFEFIWHYALHFEGPFPVERDYLRVVHHPPGLWLWADSLNSDLCRLGHPCVSVTSIWVDHTPQCWYTQRNGAWLKPSCELADLLIVTWDDENRKAGRALLVQAKRGKSYNRISISNKSTKTELRLLGTAPKFLLSSQTSTTLGSSPSPLNPKINCEFKLPSYENSRLEHCTFLQIKDAKARRWPMTIPSWQTIWPPASYSETYSEAILGMITRPINSLGKHFIFGNMSDDWDRLITLLINETLASSGGTARGKKQQISFSLNSNDTDCFRALNNSFEGEFPASDDPQGISTVFITPKNKG
ncbi:hypothetical protein [Aeromonas veronii]|uniref:hypothetical protein n=1 Tax=Aeromonas veronii TaxID=654 RepID=UPI0032EF479F